MRTTVFEIVHEIALQTVVVAPNPRNPDNTYLFRCYHCGKAILKIKGDIVGIYAGLVPTHDVITFYECYGCKENYTFQVRGAPADIIKLILTPYGAEKQSTFNCVICKSNCITYSLNMSLPKDFVCPNYTCNQEYRLQDVVSLGK